MADHSIVAPPPRPLTRAQALVRPSRMSTSRLVVILACAAFLIKVAFRCVALWRSWRSAEPQLEPQSETETLATSIAYVVIVALAVSVSRDASRRKDPAAVSREEKLKYGRAAGCARCGAPIREHTPVGAPGRTRGVCASWVAPD